MTQSDSAGIPSSETGRSAADSAQTGAVSSPPSAQVSKAYCFFGNPCDDCPRMRSPARPAKSGSAAIAARPLEPGSMNTAVAGVSHVSPNPMPNVSSTIRGRSESKPATVLSKPR